MAKSRTIAEKLRRLEEHESDEKELGGEFGFAKKKIVVL